MVDATVANSYDCSDNGGPNSWGPLNLVYRTNLSEPSATGERTHLSDEPPVHRNSKLYVYDDGGETIAVFKGGYSKPKVKKEPTPRQLSFELLEALEQAERDKEAANEERAGRRARVAVRRFTRWNQLSVMVTLTFPGDGVHDYDQAYNMLRDYLRLHGGRQILSGAYLAVAERHPGGHGIHWHMLLQNRLTFAELHRLRVGWTKYLRTQGMQPTGGANFTRVHVKDFKVKGIKGAARTTARYAGKYVTKTFAEGGAVPPGRKRYLCSLEDSPIPQIGAFRTVIEWRQAIAALRGGDMTGFWFDSMDLEEDWKSPNRVLLHIWND